MNQVSVFGMVFLILTASSGAADLSIAPPSDLLAIYKQLRTIQAGDSATTDNVSFKRDAATFTFSGLQRNLWVKT